MVVYSKVTKYPFYCWSRNKVCVLRAHTNVYRIREAHKTRWSWKKPNKVVDNGARSKRTVCTRFPWTWLCKVPIDEHMGLRNNFHGQHTRGPWMMFWWRKKNKGKGELIGFFQDPQRGFKAIKGNNSHVRGKFLGIHVWVKSCIE